jgi:hypothetical protein
MSENWGLAPLCGLTVVVAEKTADTRLHVGYATLSASICAKRNRSRDR